MRRIIFLLGFGILICLFDNCQCYAMENSGYMNVEVNSIEDLYSGLGNQIYNHQDKVTYTINSYDIFYRLKEILNKYEYHYCDSEPLQSGCYLMHYVEEFYYTTIDWRSLKGSRYEVEIELKYYYSQEEMNRYFNEMQQVADDLKQTSDYKSVKAAHDYVIRNVDYDYNYKNFLDMEGFQEGEMVCNGYCMAMFLLLTDMDIPVRMFGGTAVNENGDSVGHAWNLVNIDGGWYALDATWDDLGKYGCGYTYFLKGKNEFENHVCDKTISKEWDSLISDMSYKPPFLDRFVFGLKNFLSIQNIIYVGVFIVCIATVFYKQRNKYYVDE